MENPFPGMDPWMEDQWGDAHHSLITFGREQLRPQMPPGLRARVEERVYVQADDRRERNLGSDLRVIERTRVLTNRPGPAATNGGIAVAEPLVVHLAADPMTQGYIQIIDRRSGGRVITVIEVLSPSNKVSGTGRQLYLQKQQECLAAGVNLVELGLLRGGQWALAVPRDAVPDPHVGAYHACVWRGASPFDYELYSFAMRDRLPAIRIPLREGDTDVVLDLQPLINQAYESGEYDDTDYTADPVPRLSPDDATWAAEILRSKGLRK